MNKLKQEGYKPTIRKPIVTGYNLNVIIGFTYIKKTLNNVILNKTHPNCSKFKENLNTHTNNVKNWDVNIYIYKQQCWQDFM